MLTLGTQLPAPMLSPVCSTTAHRPWTSCGVPSFRVRSLRWGSFPAGKCAPRVDCFGAHISHVTAADHPRPPTIGEFEKVGTNLTVDAKSTACGCGFPHRVAMEEVRSAADLDAMRSARTASRSGWTGRLPGLALILSAVFLGPPAYAYVKDFAQPDVNIQVEAVSSSSTSVEVILAKQLARRFREMSDEELVDILQQLLKASKSFRGFENSAIVPEDSVTKTTDDKRGTQSTEKIGDVNGKETQGRDMQMNRVSTDRDQNGSEPAVTIQGGREVDESIASKISPPVDDEAETRTHELDESAKIQETSPSNASVKTNSSTSTISRAASAAESSSGITDLESETTGEPENLTELLWAEWARRTRGSDLKVSESSDVSSNVIYDYWQTVKSYSGDVTDKVSTLASSFIDRYKLMVGIVSISCALLVLAFKLGRARASSPQADAGNSEGSSMEPDVRSTPPVSSSLDPIGDVGLMRLSEDWTRRQGTGSARVSGRKVSAPKGTKVSDTGVLERRSSMSSMEAESSVDSSQLLKDTSLNQSPRNDRLPFDAEAHSQKWRGSTADRLPSQSKVRTNGREEISSALRALRNVPRREVANSSGEDTDAADLNTLEMEPFEYPRHHRVFANDASQLTRRHNPSMSGQAPPHPIAGDNRREEVTRPSTTSRAWTEREPTRMGRGSNAVDIRNAKAWDMRDGKLTGGARYQQGQPSTGDQNDETPVTEREFTNASNPSYRDQRKKMVDIVKNRTPTRNLEFQESSSRQLPKQQEEELDYRSVRTVSKSFARQADILQDADAKQSEASNESWRNAKDESVSWSRPELNSFVNHGILYIRDADGVFVRQPHKMEDRYGNIVKVPRSDETDLLELSSRAGSSSLYRRSKELLSCESPQISQTGAPSGFDYRRLIIDFNKKFRSEKRVEDGQSDRNGVSADHGGPMLPFRYGPENQNVDP